MLNQFLSLQLVHRTTWDIHPTEYTESSWIDTYDEPGMDGYLFELALRLDRGTEWLQLYTDGPNQTPDIATCARIVAAGKASLLDTYPPEEAALPLSHGMRFTQTLAEAIPTLDAEITDKNKRYTLSALIRALPDHANYQGAKLSERQQTIAKELVAYDGQLTQVQLDTILFVICSDPQARLTVNPLLQTRVTPATVKELFDHPGYGFPTTCGRSLTTWALQQAKGGYGRSLRDALLLLAESDDHHNQNVHSNEQARYLLEKDLLQRLHDKIDLKADPAPPRLLALVTKGNPLLGYSNNTPILALLIHGRDQDLASWYETLPAATKANLKGDRRPGLSSELFYNFSRLVLEEGAPYADRRSELIRQLYGNPVLHRIDTNRMSNLRYNLTAQDIKTLGPGLAERLDNRLPLYRGMALTLKDQEEDNASTLAFWRSAITTEAQRQPLDPATLATCRLHLLELLLRDEETPSENQEATTLVEQLKGAPLSENQRVRLRMGQKKLGLPVESEAEAVLP